MEDSGSTIGASRRLFVSTILLSGQRKWLVTLAAVANFKKRQPLLVNFGRQEQFGGIVSEQRAVGEFHDGQPDVEELEGGFLALTLWHVSDDKDRLSSPLGPQVFQRALRISGNGKSAARAGTGCEHRVDGWVVCMYHVI
jgi:hypothetical protein